MKQKEWYNKRVRSDLFWRHLGEN